MGKLSTLASAVKSWGKGLGSAVVGKNEGRMAGIASEALSSQHKKHLLHLGLAAGGATGLAGLTYLKGRNDGMQKKAGALANAVKALKNSAKYHAGKMSGAQQVAHIVNSKMSPDAQVSFAKGVLGVGGVGLGAGVLAGGVSGYALGKHRGMKKHAGLFSKATIAEKATKAVKGKYKAIEAALKSLPDDTKKHLMKKVKIKRGHLYAAGTGVAAAGLGAGYLAGKE